MAIKKKRKGRLDPTERMSELEARIKPISELPFKVSMVIYGRSGSGKTTFAATMPGPILLLDAREDGTDSICDVEGVDVLPIKNWEDVELAYYFLKSKKGRAKYKSVILDTVTKMQDILLNEICDENNREQATKREWGQLGQRMKPWFDNYTDLPQHVAFLCQDRTTDSETEDDDQMTPEVGPRLSPSIASALNAAVKIIAQAYIKEVVKHKEGKVRRDTQYRLRIGPHPIYLTKIRMPKRLAKPESIINPTFDDVVRITRGEYVEPIKKKGVAINGAQKEKAER